MSDNEALVAVASLLLVIVAPIVLIGHYVTKWRSMRGDGIGAEQAEALRELARRMEMRIDNLETILDAEAPGWRSRSGTR